MGLPFRIATPRLLLRPHEATDAEEVHPTWAVCLGDSVVGSVNIRFFDGHRIAEFGYGIARSYWGQGLTTEAMRAIIDASFATYLELARVRARADAENLGSRRVMEKLGMTLEGVMRRDRIFFDELRDDAIYGLLRAEWSGAA